MLRRVTWRFWAALAGVAAAYVGLGFAWSHNGRVETDVYTIGLAAWFLSPLAFMAVWSAMGKKWWLNDVGVNLVLTEAATLIISGPLLWVFLFHHGILDTPWLGWTEIAGPLAVAGVLGWRNTIWLRQQREANGSEERSDT